MINNKNDSIGLITSPRNQVRNIGRLMNLSQGEDQGEPGPLHKGKLKRTRQQDKGMRYRRKEE